jgi:hypothetical protein
LYFPTKKKRNKKVTFGNGKKQDKKGGKKWEKREGNTPVPFSRSIFLVSQQKDHKPFVATKPVFSYLLIY